MAAVVRVLLKGRDRSYVHGTKDDRHIAKTRARIACFRSFQCRWISIVRCSSMFATQKHFVLETLMIGNSSLSAFTTKRSLYTHYGNEYMA